LQSEAFKLLKGLLYYILKMGACQHLVLEVHFDTEEFSSDLK
jgi:hypothetical protein